MTETLKNALRKQADDLGNLPVDLDRIISDGDRVLRRRRTAGLAVAACAAVAATAVLTTIPRGGDDALQPGEAGPRPFTYAVGSVVHQGAMTIDVGRPVRALVQTEDGVVFTTPERSVMHTDVATGATDRIGILSTAGHGRRLTVDEAGDTVAWIETEASQLAVSIFDVTSGGLRSFRVEARTQDGETMQPQVIAIDGTHVYYWDDAGLSSYDMDTWDATLMDADATPDTLSDAANGMLLHQAAPNSPDAGAAGLAVTTQLADESPLVPGISEGDLSADGRHVLTQQADQFAVFDVATGKRQDPAHPDFPFAAPYQWLDDDTIAALALAHPDEGEDAKISLLTCHLSTNDCEVTVPDAGGYRELAIPFGEALGDD